MCLAASTPFHFWSHRGLETPLYIFLLLYLFDVISDKRKIHYWFVPAFLIFCSRPEGFLMVTAILPWILYRRKGIENFGRSVTIFCGLCLALLAWRFYYFHDLLPHAFYHKIGGNALRGAKDFLTYAWYNDLFLLALLALPAFFKKSHWQREFVPLLLLLCVTAFWGVIGADWKSFNRQLASFLPFYFLWVFIFINRNWLALGFKKIFLTICSVYLFFLFVLSPYTTSRDELLMSPNFNSLFNIVLPDPVAYQRNLWQALTNPDTYMTQAEPTLAGDHIGFNRNATVGRFIKANYPEDSTVIFDQMGQAPWYAGSDKTFIDNTGLTDKTIGYFSFHHTAERSGLFGLYESILIGLKKRAFPEERHLYSNAEIVERFYALNPELVLVRERYIKKNKGTLIAHFFYDPRFEQRYRKGVRINKRDVVYERRDLPVLTQPIVPAAALVESDWSE